MHDSLEHELIAATQLFLARSEWTASGDDFFMVLAKYLAETLRMDYVCIAKLQGDEITAQPLSIYFDSSYKENISYSLKDTPCGNVFGRTICTFSEGVRHLFPSDLALQELKAEGYIGTSLWDSSGKPSGLISMISRQKLISQEIAVSILNLVSIRAAGELERKQIEQRLRDSEEKYRTLTEITKDVVWTMDVETMKFTYVSPSVFNLRGYTPEEILAESVFDALTPGEREYVRNLTIERVAEFLSGKKSKQFFTEQIEQPCKDGSTVSTEVLTTFFTNNKTGKVEVHGVTRDISKRRSAEKALLESELKFRTIVSQSLISIQIMNSEGVTVSVNSAWEKLWKLKLEDLKGYNILSDPQLIENGVIKYIREAFAGKQSFIPATYYEADKSFTVGERKWVEACIYPSFDSDGNIQNVILMHIDVTDRKEAEAIIESASLLKELNATKDKFFSIIAHDLKGPFNSILGFSSILNEKVRDRQYDGVAKYSGIIYQSASRAMDLLVNLLEWSRTQTGKIQYNPEYFDLLNLLIEVQALLRDSAKPKAITINITGPGSISVYADKPMISAVLRNLVSNSIKFTGTGGAILISIKEYEYKIEVSVLDNGIGIPKEEIDKLFRIDESFSTPGTENERGTGLGLILCKEFIDKHNGIIWAESGMEKGSKFCFTLPKI